MMCYNGLNLCDEKNHKLNANAGGGVCVWGGDTFRKAGSSVAARMQSSALLWQIFI